MLSSRYVVTYGRIKLGRSAVMSSALDALAVRERWAAMQRENLELTKSGEEDG